MTLFVLPVIPILQGGGWAEAVLQLKRPWLLVQPPSFWSAEEDFPYSGKLFFFFPPLFALVRHTGLPERQWQAPTCVPECFHCNSYFPFAAFSLLSKAWRSSKVNLLILEKLENKCDLLGFFSQGESVWAGRLCREALWLLCGLAQVGLASVVLYVSSGVRCRDKNRGQEQICEWQTSGSCSAYASPISHNNFLNLEPHWCPDTVSLSFLKEKKKKKISEMSDILHTLEFSDILQCTPIQIRSWSRTL